MCREQLLWSRLSKHKQFLNVRISRSLQIHYFVKCHQSMPNFMIPIQTVKASQICFKFPSQVWKHKFPSVINSAHVYQLYPNVSNHSLFPASSPKHLWLQVIVHLPFPVFVDCHFHQILPLWSWCLGVKWHGSHLPTVLLPLPLLLCSFPSWLSSKCVYLHTIGTLSFAQLYFLYISKEYSCLLLGPHPVVFIILCVYNWGFMKLSHFLYVILCDIQEMVVVWRINWAQCPGTWKHESVRTLIKLPLIKICLQTVNTIFFILLCFDFLHIHFNFFKSWKNISSSSSSCCNCHICKNYHKSAVFN